MLITKEDLSDLWKFLTTGAIKDACSTMIFIANNCDALCACKILTEILKQSSIQYTWVPVFSYKDIETNLSEDVMSSDITSLIFLNCGAKLDFTQFWFSQQENPVKTFVFESQRPISHNNILTQKAVYVVDFGDIDVAECPEDADIEAMEEEMEAEGEDQPVDGEKEYQLIINGGKNKDDDIEEDKEQMEDDEKNPNEDEDFDENLIGKKRPREQDKTATVDTKKKRLMRVTNYYSGNYYSKSCAYLLYCLGVQLNKQTVDSFWLWILGLTDQLIHSKITSFQYDEELGECQKEFLSITDQNFEQENESIRNNLDSNEDNQNKKFDAKGHLYAQVTMDSENIKIGSILPQQEFRFMFLRAWTLFKSIFYSNYVVSKLRLWQDMGKRELNRFFAMLGIPSEEYNQQYRFMNPKYKEILKSKIIEIAPKFDLENILFSSFVRQIDNKTQMNAADMVYAITSLLESPRNVMIDNVPNVEHEAEDAKGEDDQEQNNILDQDNYREMQIDNFWAAYKALDIQNKPYLDYGITLSKEMQMALMSQGTSLITNKRIMPCTKFRYAIIGNDSLAETKIFQYPMAIQKLALFIMEAYKETRSTKEDKAMVVWVKNTARDSFIIVGVMGKETMFSKNKNEFGQNFQEAAEKVGASFKYDGFETSVIEVSSESFEDFIDELIQV